MGWKIESLDIEGNLGTARPFNIVYTLPQGRNVRTASYRGDGLLLSSGTVRLNREQYIKQMALQHGVDPQELISAISQHIASEQTGVREVAQAV